jgi:hypothetical protein
VNSQTRIRVFIGSGKASRIERNTAIYSLRKNSKRELDIYVFNGTHNSVQLNDGEPELWFSYFNEALAQGYVTAEDIRLSMIRSYIRRDLLDGNFKPHVSRSLVRHLAAPVKKVLKGVASRISIA